MEDLLPPQIQDSCKLALPDGLKDLMSDISREVLRYQPRNLCKFIADYLSAMLITRDNLSVAGYIYNDICQCGCEPELQCELKKLGLSDAEVKIARDIIVSYFEESPPVQESNLLLKLVKDTSIDEDMMPAVQDAIRNAFIRHQAKNTTIYESSSESGEDQMMCAAKHTLDLYRKTAPTEETYEMMADKIQKSYRAYGVTRDHESKDHIQEPQQHKRKSANKSVTLVDPRSRSRSSSYDITFPKMTYSEETISENSLPQDQDVRFSSNMNLRRVTTISSTSLAGSFLNLPSHKPYSAHECDVLSDLEEYPEREHAYIDYTAANPHISMVIENELFLKRESSKNISFTDSVSDEAKKMGLEVDDDSESKDSNADHNSTAIFSDRSYQDDVIKIDNNYNKKVEMEQIDVNLGEPCEELVEVEEDYFRDYIMDEEDYIMMI